MTLLMISMILATAIIMIIATILTPHVLDHFGLLFTITIVLFFITVLPMAFAHKELLLVRDYENLHCIPILREELPCQRDILTDSNED